MSPLPAFRAATILVAGLTAASAAVARPFAPAMSCAALADLVESRGAVVLSTSRTTYDRFVADSRFCQRTEITKPAWTGSSDKSECFVGYTCQERMRGDLW